MSQRSSEPMQRQLSNARMEPTKPEFAQGLRLSFILLTVAVATHLSLTGCGSIRVPARGLNPRPHGCKANALPHKKDVNTYILNQTINYINKSKRFEKKTDDDQAEI